MGSRLEDRLPLSFHTRSWWSWCECRAFVGQKDLELLVVFRGLRDDGHGELEIAIRLYG